jgi:hypothetical protein
MFSSTVSSNMFERAREDALRASFRVSTIRITIAVNATIASGMPVHVRAIEAASRKVLNGDK